MHPTEMNIDPTKGVENKAKRVWKFHKLQSDLYSPSQSSHSQTYNREKGLFKHFPSDKKFSDKRQPLNCTKYPTSATTPNW